MSSHQALERWRPHALALPPGDYRPRQPIFVLTGEAHDLATQTKRRWKTKYGKRKEILERGLDLVSRKLKGDVELELRELSDALQQAQSTYLLKAGAPGKRELLNDAESLVHELQAVLEWHFDDGVQDENDVKLANLHAEHDGDPSTPDALASELEDYAALADEHRAELDGEGGFVATDIDAARELAQALRALPPDNTATPEREEVRAALDLRNRIAELLQQKMSRVRAAARFVFRDQPEIVRQFTSTYERKKRAAARRATKKASTPGSGPATNPPTNPSTNAGQ